MSYDWYMIANRAEFLAADLPSREIELVLTGVGLKTILVTKGRLVSIVYEGVMLSIGLTEANPFAFGGFAVYLDASDNIWLGIEAAA